MNSNTRVCSLVISPHLDDEVLGCFSVLVPGTFVLYCGVNESKIRDKWVKKRPSKELRLKEMMEISNKYGFQFNILENKVNFYILQDLISSFEDYINKLRPDSVYIPNPSYNQDHRIVYEAMLTALRPHDVNHFVKKVLIYEQIQDLWNQNYHTFNPTYFKKIDLKDKIYAYQLYKSQVRSFRSIEMISSLAKLRGAQSNTDYSESFEVLRWVD